MKTYTLILLLFLMASVCGAHDAWVSGSTDRQHLSGADLNNYLHGHKETVNGTVRTGYWDYDPDVDGHWEKIQANWQASGCVTEDANGKKLYNHDCYNDWIRDGNLKPTEKEMPDNPVIPPPCTDCGTRGGGQASGDGTDTEDGAFAATDTEILTDATLKNILRITYLSYEEVSGRGRIRTYKVLTLQLTAYAPNTTHNGLVIVVNGQHYPTPYQFFGQTLLSTNDRRTVSLKAYPRNDAVFLKTNGNSAWHRGDWQAIDTFDIEGFTVSIRDSGATTDRDIVRQTDIDADGNRIGSVGGAPSHAKPKLVTVWAALKRQ